MPEASCHPHNYYPRALKLITHVLRGTRGSYDSIGVSILCKGTMHGVFSHQTHHKTHRGNEKIINNSQNNSRIDRAEDMADFHPSSMNLFQAFRDDRSQHNEQAAEDQRLKTGRITPKDHRPRPNHQKHSADDEPELSQFLRRRLLSGSTHFVIS